MWMDRSPAGVQSSRSLPPTCFCAVVFADCFLGQTAVASFLSLSTTMPRESKTPGCNSHQRVRANESGAWNEGALLLSVHLRASGVSAEGGWETRYAQGRAGWDSLPQQRVKKG